MVLIPRGRKRTIINRSCSFCDSNLTYIDKRGYPYWHFYEGNTLCHKCWNREINAKRRIKFLKKRVYIKWLKRKFQCSICDKQGMTALHHWFYLVICPWFGTQELCWDCHTKITQCLKIGVGKKNPCIKI